MPSTTQAIENKNLKLCIERFEYLDKLLDDFILKDHRQFIIVRAHRYGVPIYEYCGGVSTKEYGINQDTISCVFSITKVVTSTLIMKLQEQGLLDIGESVSTYLDCFKGKEDIQIWHLMTHTSGIDDEEFGAFKNDYLEKLGLKRPEKNDPQEIQDEFDIKLKKALGLSETTSIEECYDFMYTLYKPTKKPQEVMSYCNTGFYYLGKLIEKVSGVSLNDYSRKVIFEPLGMNDSFYCLPEEKFHKVAGRNERCCEHEWINTEDHFKWPGAMGGLKTTVVDLCRFGDMLLAKGTLDGVRILSPASVKEMWKDHNHKLSKNNPFDSWGLGFNLRSTKKDDAGVLRSANSLEHGGMCGHKFLADPEYGITISIFTGEYSGSFVNVFYPINNVIISALDCDL